MSVFGSYCRLDILWSVNKLARAVTKWTEACDKRLAHWISYIHNTWIQPVLLCGKRSTTMQIRIVSRFGFCRRPWRLKINIRWTLMHFRKSNSCANKLDVQETDLGLTQLTRSRAHISWCKFTHGWDSRSRSLAFSDWSISFLTEPKMYESHGETCRGTPHYTWKTKIQPSTSIWIWMMLITFRLTWDPLDLVLCSMSLMTMKPWLRWWWKAGVQQWDTCQEPTGLLWIGCLNELICIPRFKFDTSTPNINSQTF